MSKNHEKIFRTYFHEEVIEAINYVHEYGVQKEFEFNCKLRNINYHYQGQTLVITHCKEFPKHGHHPRFLISRANENGIIAGSPFGFETIKHSNEYISTIDCDSFEGWCPGWEERDIVNVKPVHEKFR